MHGNKLSQRYSVTTSSKYHKILVNHFLWYSTDDRNGFLEAAEYRGQQTPPHKYDPIRWVPFPYLISLGLLQDQALEYQGL